MARLLVGWLAGHLIGWWLSPVWLASRLGHQAASSGIFALSSREGGLGVLFSDKNPALPKDQIDQLKKALPKCNIYSNPTK